LQTPHSRLISIGCSVLPDNLIFPAAKSAADTDSHQKMPQSVLLFRINDTAIILLHPGSAHISTPTVVQVTVRVQTRDDTMAFFDAQHEVSDLILRLVYSHLQDPIPSPILFEGSGYTLVAEHARWKFGTEKLEFSWGGQHLSKCKDKWVFSFNSLR